MDESEEDPDVPNDISITDGTNIENCFHFGIPLENLSQEFKTEGSISTNITSRENQPFSLNRPTRQFNVTPQTANKNINSQFDVHLGTCEKIIRKISLNYITRHYLTTFMTLPHVKAFIMIIGCGLLAVAGYGSQLVRQDLDISEMIPDDMIQKTFFEMQKKYFSYYDFQVITQKFDYANYQKVLYEFYDKLSKVKNVVQHTEKDESSRFWLTVFSEWTRECEKKFRKEWSVGNISKQCVPNCKNASHKARVVYRILSTTKNDLNQIQPNITEKLVYEDGTINPKWFYLALSFWYNLDYLGAAKVMIKPSPRQPTFLINEDNFNQFYYAGPAFITMSFSVNGLKTTKDYIEFIKNIRSICDEFKARGLPAYPTGIPFTYWEQFSFLKEMLIRTGLIIILVTWLLTTLTLMNAKAATFVTIFMLCTSFELYGLLGLLQIKLNAMSVVVLIISIGISIEYSLHIVLAFVNTAGNRSTRMKAAIEITSASSIDGIISTMVMTVVLSYSKYEFVNRYFFNLLSWLMLLTFINGLFVLPIMLSFFGPCCEVTNQAIAPTIPPAFVIKITPTLKTNGRQERRKKKKKPRRIQKSPTLTTITERTEQCSTAGSRIGSRIQSNREPDSASARPNTPAISKRLSSDIFIEDVDSDYDDRSYVSETDDLDNSSISYTTNQSLNSHRSHRNGRCYPNTEYNVTTDKRNTSGYRQSSRSTSRIATANVNTRQENYSKQKKTANKKRQRRHEDEDSDGSSSYSTRNEVPKYPYITEVQSCDRSTTKVKTTISIEVETSHPIGRHYDDYNKYSPVNC